MTIRPGTVIIPDRPFMISSRRNGQDHLYFVEENPSDGTVKAIFRATLAGWLCVESMAALKNGTCKQKAVKQKVMNIAGYDEAAIRKPGCNAARAYNPLRLFFTKDTAIRCAASFLIFLSAPSCRVFFLWLVLMIWKDDSDMIDTHVIDPPPQQFS